MIDNRHHQSRLIFAPDMSRRINHSAGKWMDGLSDIEWPRGLYVGCLGYLIITAFLIAVWVAGFVICIAWWAFLQFHIWGFQIAVLIVASPFAVIYALQRQKRQHQLARELECQYYAERGNAQVSVDDFKAWVREQENK